MRFIVIYRLLWRVGILCPTVRHFLAGHCVWGQTNDKYFGQKRPPRGGGINKPVEKQGRNKVVPKKKSV